MHTIESRHLKSVEKELNDNSYRQIRYQQRIDAMVYPCMRPPNIDDEICVNPKCNHRIYSLYASFIGQESYKRGFCYCSIDCKIEDIKYRDDNLCRRCNINEVNRTQSLCGHVSLCNGCFSQGLTCPLCVKQPKYKPQMHNNTNRVPSPMPSSSPGTQPSHSLYYQQNTQPRNQQTSIQEQYEIYRQHAMIYAKPMPSITNAKQQQLRNSL